MKKFDLVVIGGGLAGLATSIELARRGHSIALFEKEDYPYHKVCGEYISLESWNYLLSLDLPLNEWNLPIIRRFEMSSPKGSVFRTRLPLGGFGVSRFLLDSTMAELAVSAGVEVFTGSKVVEVNGDEIEVERLNGKETVKAKLIIGSFGKKSNLDARWKRAHLKRFNPKLDNYVGVKYHIQSDLDPELIALHNFKGGYCGVSKIEGERYCYCYLTHADAMKPFGGNLQQFESEVLHKNPLLKTIASNSKKGDGFPLTISGVNFQKKELVHDNVIMMGDSAGTIPPLCGNGMSMALHAAKIFSGSASQYLSKKITKAKMLEDYTSEWNYHFASRLWRGRQLQNYFGNRSTEGFVRFMKFLPFLAGPIIRSTHGKPF